MNEQKAPEQDGGGFEKAQLVILIAIDKTDVHLNTYYYAQISRSGNGLSKRLHSCKGRRPRGHRIIADIQACGFRYVRHFLI